MAMTARRGKDWQQAVRMHQIHAVCSGTLQEINMITGNKR